MWRQIVAQKNKQNRLIIETMRQNTSQIIREKSLDVIQNLETYTRYLEQKQL